MSVVADSDAVSGSGEAGTGRAADWRAPSLRRTGLRKTCLRKTLSRLALLKAGRGLDAGPSVVEIDGGKVQVIFVESGFKAGNLGTEPAGKIAIGVNGDADLTLLNDGMNLNRAESVGADAQMHLGVHLGICLQIGGGTGRDGRGRRNRGSGVEHLVSLGQLRGGIGPTLGWGRGGWRSGRGQRRRGISSGGDGGWRVVRCRRSGCIAAEDFLSPAAVAGAAADTG